MFSLLLMFYFMSIVNLIPKIISEANQNKGKKTEEVNEIDTSTFFEGRENAIHLSAVDFSFVGD